MRLRRLVATGAIVVGVVIGAPGVASAHPLGNFTVNQASALRVASDHVAIDHVVDMAEIPTFQTRSDIDRNHDGTPSAAERRAWSRTECGRIAAKLVLTVDGARSDLGVQRFAARFLEGQAGLATLRLECSLDARLAATSTQHRVQFENHYGSGRIGWREITALGDGARLIGSPVPTVSPSASLTKYPTDRLSSPLLCGASR